MSDAVWDGITRAETLKADGYCPAEVIVQTSGMGRGRARTSADWEALYPRSSALVRVHTAQGERALDIAERKGHSHLQDLLAPVLKQDIPLDALGQIQQHFH